MTALQQWWFGGGRRRNLADYAYALGLDNPYIWWKMDEPSGSSAGADSGTLGLPFTNDPDSVAFGASPLWQHGASISLNGTGFNGAVTAHTSDANFDGEGFTVTALVNWNGTGKTGAVVAHGETNVDWANWAMFVDTAGHVTCWLSSANTSAARVEFTTTSTLTPNQTYRLLLRWIKSTGEVGIWIDDTRVLTDTWAHTLWVANSPIGIGTVPHASGLNDSSAPFIGRIDEIAVYAAPLTDDRVHAHWLALQGTAPPTPTVFYRLREDGGYMLREDGGRMIRE